MSPEAPRLNPGNQIGFVGLGNMGVPMARRLLDAGYLVKGFDRAAAAGAALQPAGGYRRAPSVAQLAGDAAAVILMLPDSSVVERVLLGDGLLDLLDAGSLVIDMGSSRPEETRRLAGEARSRGVRLMDAPVSGGVPAAEEGTLTVMAGGPEEWLDEARPLLTCLGSNLIHAGPVGAGHALKALNNLLSASHLMASSEALAIGKRFGLDPVVMMDAINQSSGRSWSTLSKWPRYLLPGRYDSGFLLRLLVKDAAIAVDLARAAGVEAGHAEATLRLWRQAAEELPPEADHTEIHRWVEGRSP